MDDSLLVVASCHQESSEDYTYRSEEPPTCYLLVPLEALFVCLNKRAGVV